MADTIRGPFLTDIVYIEDGNPDTLDGLIHITKRLMEYKTICVVLRGQSIPYNFKKIPNLYAYFYLLVEQRTEDQIERLSEKRMEEEEKIESP